MQPCLGVLRAPVVGKQLRMTPHCHYAAELHSHGASSPTRQGAGHLTARRHAMCLLRITVAWNSKLSTPQRNPFHFCADFAPAALVVLKLPMAQLIDVALLLQNLLFSTISYIFLPLPAETVKLRSRHSMNLGSQASDLRHSAASKKAHTKHVQCWIKALCLLTRPQSSGCFL